MSNSTTLKARDTSVMAGSTNTSPPTSRSTGRPSTGGPEGRVPVADHRHSVERRAAQVALRWSGQHQGLRGQGEHHVRLAPLAHRAVRQERQRHPERLRHDRAEDARGQDARRQGHRGGQARGHAHGAPTMGAVQKKAVTGTSASTVDARCRGHAGDHDGAGHHHARRPDAARRRPRAGADEPAAGTTTPVAPVATTPHS